MPGVVGFPARDAARGAMDIRVPTENTHRPSLSQSPPAAPTSFPPPTNWPSAIVRQVLHAVEGVEAAFSHQPLLPDGSHTDTTSWSERWRTRSKQCEPRNHTGSLRPPSSATRRLRWITSSMLIWLRRMRPASGFSSSAFDAHHRRSQRLWKSTPTSRSRCCAISTISSHSAYRRWRAAFPPAHALPWRRAVRMDSVVRVRCRHRNHVDGFLRSRASSRVAADYAAGHGKVVVTAFCVGVADGDQHRVRVVAVRVHMVFAVDT